MTLLTGRLVVKDLGRLLALLYFGSRKEIEICSIVHVLICKVDHHLNQEMAMQ